MYSPSVIEISLVAEEQGSEVGWQPEIGKLLEQAPCLLEAALARHAVDNDEGLAPSYVRVQTAVLLRTEKTRDFFYVRIRRVTRDRYA